MNKKMARISRKLCAVCYSHRMNLGVNALVDSDTDLNVVIRR